MSDKFPAYCKHKQSGQAIVTLNDGLGGRRDVLLGKHGSAASRHEYARVLAEWGANTSSAADDCQQTRKGLETRPTAKQLLPVA